jgi:hypothetical protein
VHDEVGRLVALEPCRGGIESEIGDEALEHRDDGQHAGWVALGTGTADRFVAGIHEDAGMSVERGADVVAGPHRREQLFHHLRIGLAPGLSPFIETVERTAAWIRALNPLCGQGLGDEVENLVRPLDCRGCLRRHLLPQRDPRSDDGERAAIFDQVFD